MKQKCRLSIVCLVIFTNTCTHIFSQCPAGQSEVRIDVSTNNFGSETYWELLPDANACGTGTIFAGGNPSIGCNGGGDQTGAPGGYGDHITVNEGPWCLPQGGNYKIIYVDDYGDGGATFDIRIDGFTMYEHLTGSGNGAGTTLPFSVTPPLAYDMSGHHINTYGYVNPGNVDVKAEVFNRSTNTITSMNIHYQAGSGPVATVPLTGLNIAPFTEYAFVHPTPWNVVNGTYTLKVWASNLNGNADLNMGNDTVSKNIIVGPGIPDIIDSYIGITPSKTIVADAGDGVAIPRDLDFHPTLTNKDLWIILKETEMGGGKTIKISHAGEPGQTALLQQDGNAMHFMCLPTGIAFSENENFATSPGVFDANHDGGDPFTGPSLWSSDPAIYAQPSGGNGSHMDMLHESPYCMGIAYEVDNAFWVNDGYHDCVVRYDFQKDHGPGNDDHSDGIVRRYEGMGLVEESTRHVPSHMVLDKATGWLYIADTGNERIVRLDIHTGTVTGTFPPIENPEEASVYGGYTSSTYISGGLNEPSGIDMIGNKLLVSDHATGEIIIYDCSGATGTELYRLQTGTPGIMGIKIGPDGKIWYVNATTNQVVRLENINSTGIDENENAFINIYPNPSSDFIHIYYSEENYADMTIDMINISGQKITSQKMMSKNQVMDISTFSKGIYFVHIIGTGFNHTQKIVIR